MAANPERQPIVERGARMAGGARGRALPVEEIPYPLAVGQAVTAMPTAWPLLWDRVRWGPIVAGFVTAVAALTMLSLLGIALGLTTVTAGPATVQEGLPPDAARNAALWGALSGIVAFLLGGYVAGRTAGVVDRGWGALNGAMVFLFGVLIALWLAGQGLGAVLGTLGMFTASLGMTAPGSAQTAFQQAAGAIQPSDIERTAEQARNAAWIALLVLALGLGAGALGGYLGTRREARGHVAGER